MLIDIIGLLLLLMALFKGWRNGLISGVFSFLALIIGLAAALKLSALAAGYIGEAVSVSERWLPFVAFAVVFLAVVLLVRLGARAIEGVLQVAQLGWANRLGGIVFYILLYFLIFSVFLFYTVQLGVFKESATSASVCYPLIAPFAPQVVEALGGLIPLFRDLFEELQQFFQGVSKEVPPPASA